MAEFKLRIPEQDLPKWSERYSYPSESTIVEDVAPGARKRGNLTKDEFLTICRWKSPRSSSCCRSNDAELVEQVTRVALSDAHEELKIGVLPVLHGVGWPTASVILHFCDRREYPILDYRALWSLGIKSPPH